MGYFVRLHFTFGEGLNFLVCVAADKRLQGLACGAHRQLHVRASFCAHTVCTLRESHLVSLKRFPLPVYGHLVHTNPQLVHTNTGFSLSPAPFSFVLEECSEDCTRS
jgi:hypothetical protein